MTGRASIDYKEAERQYVIEGKSVRQVSKDMGLKSWSSMNAVSLREDWKGKRQAYLNSIARRSYETAAATVASEQAEIRNETVLAARATIRAYISRFRNADGTWKPDVEVTARDALLWAQFLMAEIEPVAGASSEVPDVRNVTPPDADLLRRVVEAARNHVAPAGSLGSAPLVESSPTRPN